MAQFTLTTPLELTAHSCMQRDDDMQRSELSCPPSIFGAVHFNFIPMMLKSQEFEALACNRICCWRPISSEAKKVLWERYLITTLHIP